jgi:hypothetical protein
MQHIYLFGSMLIGLGIIGLSVCLGPNCCIEPCIDNNIIILTHNLLFKKVYEHESENINGTNTLEEHQPLLQK